MKKVKGIQRIGDMVLFDETEFQKRLSPKMKKEYLDNNGKMSWLPFFDASRIVYRVRKTLGITQGEMAKKCGVTTGYISNLENNRYEGIGIKTIEKILDKLGYGLQVRIVKKAA